MSDGIVLVDTSAWLAVAKPPHGRAAPIDVVALQTANRIATNWLIKSELLIGAKDEQEYRRLDDELNGLHALALHEGVWQETARLRFRLRRKGYLVPLVDAAIAGCAMVYGCELLHADRHFDLIARHAPLKVSRLAAATTK